MRCVLFVSAIQLLQRCSNEPLETEGVVMNGLDKVAAGFSEMVCGLHSIMVSIKTWLMIALVALVLAGLGQLVQQAFQ